MPHLALNPTTADSRRVADYVRDIDFPRYASLLVGTFGHPQSGIAYAFPQPGLQRTLQSAEEMRIELIQKFAGGLSVGRGEIMEFVIDRRRDERQAEKQLAKPMAWLKNVNNKDAPGGIFAISKTMNSLFRQLEADKENELVNINRALSQIEFEKANPYHAIAVMRALLPFRKLLGSWTKVESKMRESLSTRFAKDGSVNVEALMHGLGADE